MSAHAGEVGAPSRDVVLLDQGWDAETRAAFYQTPQGSRMLPYDWFLHLERATSAEKLRTRSNMERMGFIVDKASPSNPDGLPVGFARDEHPTRGAAIGLTCAACHTGELEYEGVTIRIDGGQSLADIEQFQDALLASLEATLAEPAKLERFCRNIHGQDASPAECATLRGELEDSRDWWSARIDRSRGIVAHGPGRTDAFTIIGNEVVCVMLGVPANCRPAIAPTQYPFLWGTPDLQWVQYNSSAHNPLARNVGEVTGVFAESALRADGSIDSTADVDNLYQLEEWIKELQAPSWPEAILGPIDGELAARGAEIYGATCASCHALDPQPRSQPNAYGATFALVSFGTPLAQLGTDPTAALAFATRRADPGPWRGIAQYFGLIGPDGNAAAASLIGLATRVIIEEFFAVNAFTPLQMLTYVGFRQSLSPTTAQLTTYKARSLHGIAFTAPYLHNGSVPSIYELLLPPAQRSTQFAVGNREYDPVRLGYSTEPSQHSVMLDTTAVGNGNSGHLYGTDLPEADRMAVIEFLKTL